MKLEHNIDKCNKFMLIKKSFDLYVHIGKTNLRVKTTERTPITRLCHANINIVL